MEIFYQSLFAGLAILAGGLVYKQGVGGGHTEYDRAFKSFRNNYLLVYSLAMLGDWLQGPYVYALYEQYNYSVGEIGQLFIAGFGASMVFGTVVGSLADKYGRRTAAYAYVVCYALSCVTKHSPKFEVLMLGRVLGGIATSLLFSAFESWLVSEHFSRGFPESALGDIFSWAVFLGNGLIAILAGLLGNFLVETMGLGRVAPFDASFVALLLGGAAIFATWPENYGDKNSSGLVEQFKGALGVIASDKRVALLGAMQSMFEASMYTFVFMWTPALSPNKEHIPHGMIFACYMAACMVGSALSGLLMKHHRPESYMAAVFGVSALSLTVPFLVLLWQTPDPTQKGQPIGMAGYVQLLVFCLFEVCVGLFWPSFMRMRATYVPEEMRATIINCFRVPLNLFVCIVLARVEYFSPAIMFGLCVTLLTITMFCQIRLETLSHEPSKLHPGKEGYVPPSEADSHELA